MNLDKMFVVTSDFKDEGKVVMVAQMSSFDMNPIKVVMVTNFFPPDLSDVWVFPFVASSVVSVMVDFTEMFKNKFVDNNFFVTHD